MPMEYFPYARSTFFGTADKVLSTPAGVAAALMALSSGVSILTLADRRRQTGGLTKPSYDHFAAHWLTSNGSGGTVSFPRISKARVNAVLTEGLRQAVRLADAKQLPVCTAWVCAADENTFEVVTILNEGINVQVLVITPKPADVTDPAKAVLDSIRVTRYFDDDWVLSDLKKLLTDLGSTQDPLVEGSDNGELDNVSAKAGAGTFDVFT